MALGSSVWRKYGNACSSCGKIENLTRHHLKDKNGKKTGVITVLCRSCHDRAEMEYIELGIVKPNLPIQLTRNEQLQLDYMNGIIPFYSLGTSQESSQK